MHNPDEQGNTPFLSLLDIDPHERIVWIEKEVEQLTPDDLLARGLKSLESDTLESLVCLERAATVLDTPELASALGFCLAKERTQFDRATNLCRSAIARDPENPRHYLLFGRVLLMQGKKIEAIDTYMEGLHHGESPEIRHDLQLVGTRRRPVIPILRREHILNRSLGYIFGKVSRKQNNPTQS